jgi:hypothetical protein
MICGETGILVLLLGSPSNIFRSGNLCLLRSEQNIIANMSDASDLWIKWKPILLSFSLIKGILGKDTEHD